MSGKVYVVQRPAYYSRARKGWVNKYDLSPAREFGELDFLLPPANLQRDQLAKVTDHLREKLSDYSSDVDHVLAVGDPIAIGLVCMLAGEVSHGSVSILKFDRALAAYEPFVLDINANNGSKVS